MGGGAWPLQSMGSTPVGHWVPYLRLPVPSSRGKIFWTHIQQQCPARSWRQEEDLENSQQALPTIEHQVGMRPSPGLPKPGHLKRLKLVLPGDGDNRAPVTLPTQFPGAPLLYTAVTNSEEPLFGVREGSYNCAGGLMELALGLGIHPTSAKLPGRYKNGRQVAPDNQRNLDRPAP